MENRHIHSTTERGYVYISNVFCNAVLDIDTLDQSYYFEELLNILEKGKELHACNECMKNLVETVNKLSDINNAILSFGPGRFERGRRQ